ncbi:MAG: hypothetical protein KGI29_00425 [Pseudomonadota bacterium]|nr:hypothetical protein [Pseudomonadota bacterium]MDE3038064.1 hypothetical protein [Pseudomonadota bacterium]
MIDWAAMLVMLLILSGCADETSNKQWDDIDYSRVHGAARENDPAYTAPSVIGCVDDDLYNCNK